MAIHKGQRYGAFAGLALAVALALAACGSAGGGGYGGSGTTGSSGGTSTTSSSGGVNLQCASGASVCVKTVKVKGKSQTALADAKGLTLYYFTPDSASSVTCTGSCASLWPPLLATGGSVTGTNLSGALTVVSGANGSQVAYNGHPLYRYSVDKDSGDTYGEGLFGKWFVATSALAASSGGGASPTQTPGGYGSGY